MSTESLELRILTGFHAGGVVALPNAQGLSLGSAEDNDVILRDAPFDTARLEWRDGALVWRNQQDESRLSRQHLIQSETLRLLICDPSRAWDDANDSLPVLTVSGGAPDAPLSAQASKLDPTGVEESRNDTDISNGIESSATGGADSDDGSADPGMLPSEGLGSPAETVPIRRRLRHARWALPALAAAIVFSLLSQIDRKPGESSDPNSSVQTESVQPPIEPGVLKAVNGHIKAAKLEAQVRASIIGNRIRLTGVLESDEEMENLLRRIASTTRQIDLDLLTLPELSLRVKEMSGSLAGDVTATALAPGHIMLEGTVESTGERTQLLAMAQRLIPQAISIQSRLLTRAESAMIAAGRKAPPVPAMATAPVTPAPAPTPKLPPMTAVVSGEAGYLILADGSRVLPGGMIRGVRLERIGETELIVSDPKGQRFRIAR